LTDLKEAITSLTNLGWSEYESKTYSALVQQGKSTASQIAKKSQVPANRVYQILEKLTGKGHVKRVVARGGPSFYEGVNPFEVLDKSKIEHETLISNAKNALAKLQERETDTDIPRTYTIMGSRELKAHLHEIIDQSKKSVLLSVDTLIEISNNELIDLLIAKNDQCDVKILTTPRGVNDHYEKEVLEKLGDVEVLVTEDSYSTILIVADETNILFTSYAFPDDDIETREYFGVFLEDRNMAKMFLRMFTYSWDNGTEPT
jgi:sugar-specific transcriptional regulator TrmB